MKEFLPGQLIGHEEFLEKRNRNAATTGIRVSISELLAINWRFL